MPVFRKEEKARKHCIKNEIPLFFIRSNIPDHGYVVADKGTYLFTVWQMLRYTLLGKFLLFLIPTFKIPVRIKSNDKVHFIL